MNAIALIAVYVVPVLVAHWVHDHRRAARVTR